MTDLITINIDFTFSIDAIKELTEYDITYIKTSISSADITGDIKVILGFLIRNDYDLSLYEETFDEEYKQTDIAEEMTYWSTQDIIELAISNMTDKQLNEHFKSING